MDTTLSRLATQKGRHSPPTQLAKLTNVSQRRCFKQDSPQSMDSCDVKATSEFAYVVRECHAQILHTLMHALLCSHEHMKYTGAYDQSVALNWDAYSI
jgi:hypothetical protein